MIYITYGDYKMLYMGNSIPAESFNELAVRASSKVAKYTSNKISNNNISDNCKFATCEIADLLYKQNQLIKKQDDDELIVSSETVGPHSKSYVNKSNLQSQRILNRNELENECYRICLFYLSDTGLMFRG